MTWAFEQQIKGKFRNESQKPTCAVKGSTHAAEEFQSSKHCGMKTGQEQQELGI